MNYSDTEKIRYLLFSNGFHETARMDTADIIILNTCSVRQRAEDKVLGLGRKITKLKASNPALKVFLTGCMSQRVRRIDGEDLSDSKYLQKLRTIMPWLDGVVPPGDVHSFANMLSGITKINEIEIKQSYLSTFSAFVPISSGCDNFCTYCIVPYSRGRERHRTISDIMSDTEALVKNNYRMITLLGQNVNSWKGVINGAACTFPNLLKEVDSISGKYWLTFLTSHPKDLSDSLIAVMKESAHVCNYLNLPAQSGSDEILQRMNRGYSRKKYLQLVQILRSAIPDIRLSTDIIVGFPGETEEQFMDTFRLLEEVRFGMAYISEYSPRGYGASGVIGDTVSQQTKKLRKKTLEDLQRTIMKQENERLVGKKVEMLITDEGKGMTRDLREIVFDTNKKEEFMNPGRFAKGQVLSAHASGLTVSFEV